MKNETKPQSDDDQVPKVSSDSGGSSSGNQQSSSDAFHSYRKSDSNESGGSGGSNHSSGMLSIGNSSFGFTFDSDPMMNIGGSSSGVPSEKNSEGDNSDQGDQSNQQKTEKNDTEDANATADANVANLQSLARSQVSSQETNQEEGSRKRNAPDTQQSGVQYHQYNHQAQNDESVASHDDDDEDDDDDHQSRSTTEPRQSSDSPQPKRRKKRLDERKRVERNAREKERSFRISKQINELRSLLSSGGVIVPKGTKSSVLTEAANYIRMLQQHQFRSEMCVQNHLFPVFLRPLICFLFTETVIN